MLYEHILQAFLWLVNKKIAKGVLYMVFGRMGVLVKLGLGVVRAC